MSSSWTLPVEEHSADSARFDFFIRIVPNEEIFLVEAYRNDTVDATVNRITTKKNISGSKQQRLVYGGRQLQNHQCLGDCSIEENSLVYLLGPQYANAWPAVDSLVETVCSVYRGEIEIGPAEITQKLSRFFDIIPWHNDKAVVEYLQVFSASSVPVVLGMLYSSSTEGNEEFAKESIYSFLTKCRDLPSTARSHILPAVVELCRLLKKVRPGKKLHLSCWNVFASMLESVDSEAMQLFITRALLSFSMDIALLLGTSISADLGYVDVFKELVAGIGKALEDSLTLCSEYLTALEYVNSLSSSLQKYAKEELMAVLKSRQTTLCTLIVRFAKRGVDYQWLNEFKEVTNFEARRHLAMLMLPDVDHSHLRKNFIIPASNLLVESSRQIRDASPESLQHGISVKFELEPGSGEGVTREWFQLASKAIFSSEDIPSSPFYAPCPDNIRRFSPNPGFMEYEMFEFAGRLLGLALMHNIQLNVFFDRVFFLQLAGAKIGLDDIKKTEPVLYKSLKGMLEGKTGYDGLSFEIDVERGGKVCSEDLCQDGKSVPVTLANVGEYIDLYVQHRFVKGISEQTSLFAKGFTDLLLGSISHTAFFQTLCLKDFDLMFGGEEIGIRMEDWKAHTIYGYGFEDTDEEIGWFWNIVEGMTEERQRNLLKFWTAIAFLPHGGILALPRKLQILKIYTDYPISSTCVYSLKLPAYKTFEEMKTGLELVSDDEHCIGFGMD